MHHSKKYLFPFLLVFFEMATYLSSDMYLPALPTVMRDFSITHQQIQLTLTVWFLGTISLQLILGPIADRYGRKVVLCIGGIVFTLSSLMCATATNYYVFLIARFIQGTGICFMAVPGYASIHESFDHKDAIKLLALMGSITVLAPAFGPLLGSALLTLLNWRWIFLFLVIWSAITISLLILWMPETLPKEKRHPFHLATILKNYSRILGNFRFMGLVTVFGLIFCGFITWISGGPFLVIDQFKQTPVMFSIYQTFIFISFIIANYLVKRLIGKINVKKLIQFGLYISVAISFISIFLALQFPNFLLGMIITYFIYAFGAGFTFAPLNRITIEASQEPMGSRVAIFSTLVSGFGTLATILIGLFYNKTLISIALIIFTVIIISFIIERTLKY